MELVKLAMGIRSRTGDLFAVPICVGVAIGRVGCFLAGLADDTYGKATRLPWGVDFGDGVRRHPTQLYELVFLLGLAWVLTWAGRRPHSTEAIFRWFMTAYLGWRLAVDFMKPEPVVHGLGVIQWACVAGLLRWWWERSGGCELGHFENCRSQHHCQCYSRILRFKIAEGLRSPR